MEQSQMLICQISDLHVRAPGELAYRLVDTAAFVRRCVSHILAQRRLPDAVVVTGDLADRGQPAEYEHLASLLTPLSMPVYLIAGNHDQRDCLRAAFPGHEYLPRGTTFLQYVASVGPIRLVALDTVVPMHHPPFVTGVSHMDRVGLQLAYPLEPIIRRHPSIERILCGHLHRTIFRRVGGTIAATCPSPAHQVVLDFMPEAPPQFAMEPPGYLLHRWNEAEGMTSYGVAIGEFEGPYPFYDRGKLIE